MGMDLRLPLGLLFVVIGSLLAAFGLWGEEGGTPRSPGINLNLLWGLVMLTFGLVCLLLMRRGRD